MNINDRPTTEELILILQTYRPLPPEAPEEQYFDVIVESFLE
jgi:hypothetical protein